VWIAAGLLLAMAAVYVLAFDPPNAGQSPSMLKSTGSFLWLTGPVLVAALLAPNSYSLTAVQARGYSDGNVVASSRSEKTASPLASSDPSSPVQVEVLDLVMSAQDEELVKSLEGRSVRVTGQYAPGEKSGDPTRVVRMWMLCCAADARPIGVDLEGPKPEAKAMEWVEVTGALHYVKELGTTRAVVKASVIQRTATPNESFVY
jgi:uncharacterized repeat protein (TIGR03943 family)